MKKSKHTRILSYNRILCTLLSDKDKMKTIKGTLYIYKAKQCQQKTYYRPMNQG